LTGSDCRIGEIRFLRQSFLAGTHKSRIQGTSSASASTFSTIGHFGNSASIAHHAQVHLSQTPPGVEKFTLFVSPSLPFAGKKVNFIGT
jgi:hypothetical protein